MCARLADDTRTRSEGHACHARSEGRACHARGATFDHLWRFNGYDKRAPPIFLRFSTRRDPLVGSAAPRLIIHYDSTDATSASLRGTDLTNRSLRMVPPSSPSIFLAAVALPAI